MVKIDSARETKGVITKETRYNISDELISNANYFNRLARGHWAIENNLHWYLDLTLSKDACRAGAGKSPENLSTIRKFRL